jgi:hypothetical protein
MGLPEWTGYTTHPSNHDSYDERYMSCGKCKDKKNPCTYECERHDAYMRLQKFQNYLRRKSNGN